MSKVQKIVLRSCNYPLTYGHLALPFVWFRNICPKPRFIGIIPPEYLLYLCGRHQTYKNYIKL